MIDPTSYDWVGENTTRKIQKRDFKNVAVRILCWLLVGALLPVIIVWSV